MEGADRTSVLIGSGNLTSGGLYGNYEAAVLIDVRAGERADRDSAGARLLADLRRYYETLRDDPRSSRQLDEDLIEAMSKSPGLRLGSERRRPSLNAELAAQGVGPMTPFDKSEQALLTAPAPTFDVPAAESPDDDVDDPDGDDSMAVTQVEAELVEAESEADAAELGGGNPQQPVVAAATGSGDPRFYKRLSNFDVSLTSGPGQIIVPIRFEGFFGELTRQLDETNSQGGGQFERLMHGRFVDGSTVISVEPRVILYIPGPDHPRPNREIRFTFLSRDVLLRLRQGDYLTFAWKDGDLVVTRTTTSPGGGKFDWL